ncbi:MAG: enoyl-CoA hydratase-related protein [Gemmataceae bacterium]
MSAIQSVTRPDSVAVLTFDQPGSKANVLTAHLWTEFESVLDSLATRTDLKGLVLASAKPGIFIAGADLNLLVNAPAPNDPAVRGFIEHGLRVLEKLESLPFPTCAAIDGAALGGGLEVALACDMRIAGTNPKVRLGLPEVTLGLIPGWGGTQRLPRIVGLEKASEMLTSGRPLEASEAAACGLVSQVADSASLVAAAEDWTSTGRKARGKQGALATSMTAQSGLTGAAAEAVRVMLEGTVCPLKQGIVIETEAFMRLAGSEESKRLIAAFFASRKK